MIIQCAKNMKHLAKAAQFLVNGNSKASALLSDATLSIGLASDPAHGIPAGAVQNPTFVGDSAMIGASSGLTAELEALYKKDARNVNIRPPYNHTTGKYDLVFSKSGIRTSLTADSAPLINMQVISPWNASFFPELYRQPLLYSHARDLVKRKTGSNPWAETQALPLASYSGWAQLASAGTAGANLKKNVNVQAGMMVQQIINIKIFFNFTVEETQRAADGNGAPFAGSLMAEKQRYAQYVLDMITDYLTYFGNAETGTTGLFDVNGITTWSGNTLKQIADDGANTKKGSTMYKELAKAIREFMDASYNKFDIVRVAMAPQAYNLLTSTAYSDEFNPKGTLAIFSENFEAGVSKSGGKPKIEFYSDPLLAAKTELNPSALDRLVITAPEVGAGPADEKQDILLAGIPLENFAYPVYPNSYDQQHAVLRRYAGVFAPVSQAVKVYSGFGVNA